MRKDVKVVFRWANSIGDANITHRILGKAMPLLVKEGVLLTDEMINGSDTLDVSNEVYEIIKRSAENLLATTFNEEL
jgi:electron transfer flavoprotein alpha/beta subunit